MGGRDLQDPPGILQRFTGRQDDTLEYEASSPGQPEIGHVSENSPERR